MPAFAGYALGSTAAGPGALSAAAVPCLLTAVSEFRRYRSGRRRRLEG